MFKFLLLKQIGNKHLDSGTGQVFENEPIVHEIEHSYLKIEYHPKGIE